MVDGLVQDLAGISNLMEAQEKAGVHKDEVLQSLFRSWSARLMNQPLKLSVLERQQLTAAITACPWSAEQCKSLAEIVLTSGSKKHAASNIKTTQKCFNFENFIPTDTVLKLKARTFTKVKANDDDYVMQEVAKFSVVSRLSFIAAAARQVGIVNPDECTLFKMVGILCVHDPNMQGSMTQDDVFEYMNTVQTFIKAPGPKIEFIETFPPTAELLPTKIREAAFPDGVIPPEVVMPELKTVLANFKMRGGRKSMKEPIKHRAHEAQHRPLPTHARAHEAEHRPLPSPETLRLGLRNNIIGDKLAAAPLANSRAAASSDAGDAQQLCSVCGNDIARDGQACDDVLPTADDTDNKDAADAAKTKAAVTLTEFENGMLTAFEGRKATKNAKKRPASKHIMKKPAKKMPAASLPAAAPRPVAGGCKKCRGHGCDTCRNPNFKGWRGDHKAWKLFGFK